MKANQILKEKLNLQSGDIIIYEMPYEDSNEKDFFPFNSLKNFEPSHSALWTGDFEHPVAHAVKPGYKLPGTRLTNISESRCVVFRPNDQKTAEQSAQILRNWSLASKLYSKEDYITTYPKKFWEERHEKDLNEFYQNGNEKIAGPAIPYPEPRATYDLHDIAAKRKNSIFTKESLRRAIKFASRRNLSSPEPISKGQRCTPILIAAIQAAILAPIVKPYDKKTPFKNFKEKNFEEYADQVLIPNWRDTPLGKNLLAAIRTNDFSKIFPPTIMIDQRYAHPRELFDNLNKDPHFQKIGQFSYFKDKLEVVKNGKSRVYKIEERPKLNR